MKRILFTGGGGAGNEALYRLFTGRCETHFADADVQAIDPAIPAERRHAVPFASDPQFADRLCALMERIGADLLVPGVDEELAAVARLAESGRIAALLPPLRFVERHLDKLESMRFLTAHGLAAPRTVLAEEAERVGFPFIVKPRSGRGSRGVVTIRSPEQLAAWLAFSDSPGRLIAQERGLGEEFTVMMAADAHGVLQAVVPVAVEVKRGITLRARTRADGAVTAACRAVHAADPVPGCYNIQLIREPGGRILIFEINPRVSTTLCLGVASGVDPVAVFYGEARSPAGALLPFRENLALRRRWVNCFEPA